MYRILRRTELPNGFAWIVADSTYDGMAAIVGMAADLIRGGGGNVVIEEGWSSYWGDTTEQKISAVKLTEAAYLAAGIAMPKPIQERLELLRQDIESDYAQHANLADVFDRHTKILAAV